jgi:sulfate transport system ATP-binding protein
VARGTEIGVSIGVSKVSKRFGSHVALEDVSVEVEPGELLALLGPSGCGKTTLLRIIAGLESPDEGSVTLNGENTTSASLRERQVGFVFQHYALFRHMSVFENVAFGLRVRPRPTRPAEAGIRERVLKLLRLVQLEAQQAHYPDQLSGGQRQRVALARALAIEPSVLLLDEPFGALDARVRKELRQWLRRLHDDLKVTTVFVTHDQEEALELADRVVIMDHGKVEQVGTPDDVYGAPASAFVFDFLGDVNLFHTRLDGDTLRLGPLALTAAGAGAEGTSRDATVFVRPHGLSIHREHDEKRLEFAATLVHARAAGAVVKLELTAPWSERVLADISRERFEALNIRKGDEVYVSLDPRQLFVTRPPAGTASLVSRVNLARA